MTDTSLEYSDEISLVEMLKFVRRNLLLIASVSLVCIGMIAAYVFMATPQYRAEVVVRQVAQDGGVAPAGLANRLGGFASLTGISFGADGSVNDAVAILRSNRLVEKFIRQRELEPVLQSQAQQPSTWRTVRLFKSNVLQVTEDKRANVITIAVTWREPARAAEWANGLVQLTNEILRARDKADAEHRLAFLKAELAKTNMMEMRAVLYNLIESETKSLMLADAREDYALVVLDPAVAPEYPHSPKKPQMLVIGAIFGLVMGVIFALIRASLRPRRQLDNG